MNIAGLGPNDDENNNKEVFPTRVKRDARDLENICNSIREMINPFDSSIIKDLLFNIKTGRKESPAAEHYLLSVIARENAKEIPSSMNAMVIVTYLRKLSRNLKLLFSQLRASSRKTTRKRRTRLHS